MIAVTFQPPTYYGRIMRMGIRQKVVLILVTVLLTALTISGWMALQREKRDVGAEIQNRGETISRFVAGALVYNVIGYDYHTIQLLLDEIVLSGEIGYVKVVNSKGNTMGQAGVLERESSGNMAIFHQDMRFEGEVVGKLTLGLSLKDLVQRLENQKFSLMTREAVIILLIALGEFLALSYIIVRPVRRMSESLKSNIASNCGGWRELPVISNDEFGMLALQFNDLQRQLKEANGLLQSKINLADVQLRETNRQLLDQSRELRKMNEEFRLLSVTDPLTGLYNRRHFEALIETEIAMSARHGDVNSLIMIDIDHFKRVNDDFGHFAGDMVLKDVANVLRSNIRKTDILCRLGGEEFVVMCKRAGKEEAKEIAEKLRCAVGGRKLQLNEGSIAVSISLGIATIPSAGATSLEEFYRYADVALYVSKDGGRNRFTHYEDIPLHA